MSPFRLHKVYFLFCVSVTVIGLGIPANASEDLSVFVEGGAAWQNRNDTQIPPASGTRLQIDQFDKGPFLHYRLEGYYRLNENHALRAVYAPYQVEVTGRADRNVQFNGQNFPNTADLTVNYKFNSYRLSYLYGFWGFGKDQLNLGFTAKVRDAETTFSQPGISSSYDNVGFVPLFYFEYQKAMGQKWSLNLTIDAAVAAQGRAIDAALKARRQFGRSSSLGLGWRGLEGGADNEKVFAFSWFNYAVLEWATHF